jgi:hypothetical protein
MDGSLFIGTRREGSLTFSCVCFWNRIRMGLVVGCCHQLRLLVVVRGAALLLLSRLEDIVVIGYLGGSSRVCRE